MTQAASPGENQDEAVETWVVTRFGPVAVQPERIITLQQGLVGFDHERHFILTDIPEAPLTFKLLQSVDDPDLGFIVLPLDLENGPIAHEDIESLCPAYGFEPTALLTLGIVTLRATPMGSDMTINLRAPVVIDTLQRTGCQHVFSDERYAVRAPLTSGAADAQE